MKNTILWSALITLIGAQGQVYADVTQPTSAPPPNPTIQPQPSSPPAQLPAAGQPQPSPTIAPTQPAPPPVINCDYKISAETKKIDSSLVITWSEKAVTQAFDFDPNKLDDQLQKLQACFTEQGWTGFNTALQKSGNIDAIKSQKLTVSSQVMGQATVTEAKDNQWKLNLPLQVVYQNDKEKVTQLLSIDVTVGRKITGDLGILQMIAAPKNTEQSAGANATSNNSPPPTSNATSTPGAPAQPTTAPAAPVHTAPIPTAPAQTTPAPVAPAQTSQGAPGAP